MAAAFHTSRETVHTTGVFPCYTPPEIVHMTHPRDVNAGRYLLVRDSGPGFAAQCRPEVMDSETPLKKEAWLQSIFSNKIRDNCFRFS
jgi:hypothetical protein